MAAFHDVLFPSRIAFGASGGPERRTEIVTLGSGHEERNSPWVDSRRRWDAGGGLATLDALAEAVAFFEARRGRLHGFRFRDPLDHKSCAPGGAVSPLDQMLAATDGETAVFQLTKRYASGGAEWVRAIHKPVTGSVRIALDGTELEEGAGFTLDHTTGLLSFPAAPAANQTLTAGFLFDTPVRFDTDRLEVSVEAFQAGRPVSLPLVEIRL